VLRRWAVYFVNAVGAALSYSVMCGADVQRPSSALFHRIASGRIAPHNWRKGLLTSVVSCHLRVVQLVLAFIPELVCDLPMGKHGGVSLQVFAVEELDGRTKLDLAAAINQAIREQQLSQAQASAMLRIPQPKISALANYHLDGFSVQRLLRILNALGRDVVIQVNKKKKAGSIGKTSVAAA
jgi:predicted XRE-type DNA-binding protein